MSNPYRVTSATQSGCISKGNFQIGVESLAYGPTDVTSFYAGITPPTGGYAWYKSSGTGGAHIRTAANDQTLVNIVNEEFQQGFTQASSAIQYINNNVNQYVTNIVYPGIITNGLILHYDAGFVSSYPRAGLTWSDVSGFSTNSVLVNGPIFDSGNSGSIVFDGVDDYATISGSRTLLDSTWLVWIKRNGTQPSWYGGLLFSRATSVSGLSFTQTDQLGYSWNNASNTWSWLTGLVPPDSAWCMVALVMSSSNAVIYLCQSSGITSATNSVSHSSAVIDGLRMAQDSLGAGTRLFKGNIGIVSLYNRSLSASEIQNNFNAVKSRYGL